MASYSRTSTVPQSRGGPQLTDHSEDTLRRLENACATQRAALSNFCLDKRGRRSKFSPFTKFLRSKSGTASADTYGTSLPEGYRQLDRLLEVMQKAVTYAAESYENQSQECDQSSRPTVPPRELVNLQADRHLLQSENALVPNRAKIPQPFATKLDEAYATYAEIERALYGVYSGVGPDASLNAEDASQFMRLANHRELAISPWHSL